MNSMPDGNRVAEIAHDATTAAYEDFCERNREAALEDLTDIWLQKHPKVCVSLFESTGTTVEEDELIVANLNTHLSALGAIYKSAIRRCTREYLHNQGSLVDDHLEEMWEARHE